MAVRNPVTINRRTTIEVQWSGLLNGDNGAGYQVPPFYYATVTVRGTFGTGGSVTLKGTDFADATAVTSWDALHDSRGGTGSTNALTFTARGTNAIAEAPAMMAPHVTAGDGSTNLTVTISFAAVP